MKHRNDTEAMEQQFDSVEWLTVSGFIQESVEVDGEPGRVPRPEGWVWEAEMLKPGLSLNGNTYFTPEFIQEAAKDFEGCPSYADHQATPSGSVRNVIGSFRNVRSGTGGSVLKGELHLLKSENWVREKLVATRDAGMPMGLSINAIVGMKRAVREGREVLEPQKVIPGTPRSVDLVMFPAAGGRVLRAVAGADMESALAAVRQRCAKSSARNGGESGSAYRSNQEPRQEPLIHGRLGQALEGAGSGGVDNSAEIKGEKMEQTHSLESRSGAPGAVQESLKPIREEIGALKSQLDDAQRKQRVAESQLLMSQKLASSRLPEPLAKLVREHFKSAAPSAEEIDGHIASVREAYASLVPSPTRISGPAVVTQEPQDRHQIALDKLFGMRQGLDGRAYDASVPSFMGIQEAYIAITGDRFLQWEAPAGRVTENWNAAGFANALGNSLYRRIIQDYREVDYGLDLLIPRREPHRVALKDFRSHDIVRVGYLNDLSTVDPESVDWPEITAPTDEKAQITAVQFGGLVSVTRKAIINDDIGLVAKVASRIGRAARRTMAQRVYNLMINNSVVYDSLAFFEAVTHKNLGSTALGINELDTVRTAMRNQTEKNSLKKLGIGPWILVVPVELEGTAKTTNTRDYVDSNFTPNKVQYMFGNNNERVVVCPLLSDVTDWYVFANPDEIQTFELGFLQGKEEPEVLLADNQLVGKAFTSDRIQYKVRHEFEVAVVDFRGAYKEVVAG